MAKQTDKIEKDGQIFYALIQLTFGQDPVFALGDRELGVGMIMTDVYDKEMDVVTSDCLLHINTKAIITPSSGSDIDLTDPSSHIDPATPRYWFTNTNYD